MKKSIKKVLCTAIAAMTIVSSAATINKVTTGDSFGNSIIVDAAKKKERCVDYPLYTAVKKGKIRERANLNSKVLSNFDKYACFVQYATVNNFIKVGPDTVELDEAKFLKKGWIYMGGGHLVEGCFFTLKKWQLSRKEPHEGAYTAEAFNKGALVDIKKITLEKKTEKNYNGIMVDKYRIWGCFSYKGHDCWIALMDYGDLNQGQVISDNERLMHDLINIMYKPSKFYVTK